MFLNIIQKIRMTLENIERVLQNNPDGLNLNRLAKEAGIRPSTLVYHIYGESKNGKLYGGDWADKLTIRKIGNVTIITS